MTEGNALHAPIYEGRAFMRARPSEELSHYIERFYSDDARRSLGGKALELTSSGMNVVRFHETSSELSVQPGISLGRLSVLQSSIRRRGTLTPIVQPGVKVQPLPPIGEDEHPGFNLLFTVNFDELTARELAETTFLSDGMATLHLPVLRHAMTSGDRLISARDELAAALKDKQLKVENVHLYHDPHAAKLDD